jgi:hypothetical protein
MLGSNVITTAAYDATLIAWAAQVPTTALSLNVNSTQYTLGGEAEAARTSLINTYGWTITDGGGTAEVPFVFDTIPFAAVGTVTIKTQAGFTYDYNVSVSTGESFTNQTGDLVMTFGDNVTRTFTVSGLFPGFKCQSDASARFQVQTWGSQPGRSLYAAFWHPNFTLTSIGSDLPNLFLCESLYETFKGVINFPASNNLSQWKTSQVTNFRGCFRDGTGGLNNIDITNWDTGKATVIMDMFSSNLSNWSLTSTDVSQWNTRNVTTFQQMFFNNYTFNQPIQNWDVRSATGNAFQSFLNNTTTNLGQFNQPLGLWNLNPSNYGANFFRAMFYGQNAFDQDLSAWTITGLLNVTGNFNEFITNADLVARPMSFSRANYDKLLISWGNQGFVYPEIISFGDAQYTLGGAAEAARNTLINTYGWTITDGGGAPGPSYVYSVYDITGNATNSIMISNDSLSEIDIPFNAGFIDTSLITSHSSGNYSTVTTFYDQVGGSDLTESTKIYQPRITDASGTSLTYLDDYGERVGLNNLTNYEYYDLTGDFIFQYVMNDETQGNNQRQNFSHVKTGNNISVGFRVSGSNYIIGIRVDGVNLANRWIVTKPSQFSLYTFTGIGGVYNLYINNVLQTSDGGVEDVSGAGPGITLGYRGGQTSGKINDVQTFSALYNNDLSAFDVSAYNTTYMNIHGL